MKASAPKIITDHLRNLSGIVRTFYIPEDLRFNMDEKDSMIGKSIRSNFICARWGGRTTSWNAHPPHPSL